MQSISVFLDIAKFADFWWKKCWCQKNSRGVSLDSYSIQQRAIRPLSWVLCLLCSCYLTWHDCFRYLLLPSPIFCIRPYRLHGFSITISWYYKDFCVNGFFLYKVDPEVFCLQSVFLTSDLNDFKSRVNYYLWSIGSI